MKKLLAKFQEPRWRHGHLGVALMAGFVAACVLLNVGVKTLEEKNGWTRDFSFNGYATTGEETQRVLDRLVHDVDIYLLYQNGQEDAEVHNLLKRYEVLSKRIHVKLTDITRDPGIVTRFQGELGGGVEADSVIVHCPATGRYKVLTWADFLSQGYDVETGGFVLEGLAYEKKLTEAIVYTAQEDVPVIGLLQGHGELDEDAMAVFLALLHSNNYATRTVDLRSGDALNDVDVLLLASPQKDITLPEAEQLNAWAQAGGHFFVLRDYTDPMETMPNYLSLLRSYGIVPMDGIVMAGEKDDGSYYGDVWQLLPYMVDIDMTAPLRAAKMDVLLMPYAAAFENPPEPTASLTTATVLKSGPNAYVRRVSDGAEGYDKRPGDAQGEISVALYAHRMYANGTVSRMFAAGSSALFIWEYIYESTYCEEFLMAVLGEMLPQSKVDLDIMASAALRPSLRVGSRTVGIVLLVLIPLLVLLAAFIVLWPRRNR